MRNILLSMEGVGEAAVLAVDGGDVDDTPRAFAVAEDEDGEPGSKRFKGTRKSGRVWRTRQKEP